MEFTYNNKNYMLVEMKEPNSNKSLGMMAIFEVTLNEKHRDVFEEYNFVGYFYGADDEEENLIKTAKLIIDNKE